MESCRDFDKSEINGEKISIDFKSSFARSLSDNNTGLLNIDRTSVGMLECCDFVDEKSNNVELNDQYFTNNNKFLCDNGFNKSDEDKEKQLWSITKKKHQVRSQI